MTQGPLLAIAWAGLSMHSTQHPPCVALRARLYLVSAGVWLHTRSVQASGSGGSGQVVARACAAAAEVWVACSKSLSRSMSLFAETWSQGGSARVTTVLAVEMNRVWAFVRKMGFLLLADQQDEHGLERPCRCHAAVDMQQGA